MMTKICIIVPVYNTEEYLRRCIDSILSQTYTDFELILIDDGSTDNSGEICDEYAVMDKRIVVIHQENRGQANARNVGLDYAFEKSKSEWISFVDSDDFIHSQMLQLLYQKINNTGSKVIVGDYLEFSDEKMLNSSTQVSLNLVDLAIEQPEDFFVNSCYLETVPWGKLYHKSCFCNIRYPEGKIHEDNFTTYKIIFSLDKILHVKAEVYYYFSNYKGTTKSIWTPKRLDALEAYSAQISFFDKNGYKRAKNKIIYNYANVLFNQINSIKNQKQYRQYLKQMKKMMRKHLETYKGASIISFKNHHEYYDVAYPKFILRLFGYKFYNKPLSIKSRIRKLGISSQGKILPLGKLYYQYKIKKILREKKDFAEENYPIDFVVTWVDDNDETWKAEKEKFLCTSDNLTKKDNTNIRYRNWETLRFWFRAVEKFAPWVNKVYFISCGHVPEWLNTDCKKIQVVKHDEYIPKEYLPTFSSHTIENNIWRISDLSEHFVYFNDDIFLTRSVVPSDFFQGGFPKYCAVTKPIRANNHMCSFDHALWNGLGEIISTVSIRDVMHKHPEKWLSVKLKDYYENNKKHVSNMRALLRQHLKKYHNEQGIKHNLQYYSYAYPIMTKFIRIAGFSKRILKRLIYPKSERIGLLGKIYFYHNIKKNLKQFKQTPDIDDFPVDFVVSWVNGNDPEWIQEKREYEIALDNDKKTANPTTRYRDWNMFHYWFRAVEKMLRG